LYKYFKVPGRLANVKRVRMNATLGVIAVAIAVVFLWPLPSHVYCPLEVQARGAESVYAEVEGILDQVFVKPGDQVVAGQPLAQLRNLDIDISIVDMTGKRDELEARLHGLKQARFNDEDASITIEELEEALESKKQQLAQLELDREKLKLVASRAGTVLPPARVAEQPVDEADLPTWSGSPLEPQNLGATLVVGTKFCEIGDPGRLEALLIVSQDDIEFVEAGQKVEMMMAQSAGLVYESTIEKKSAEDRKISPIHLSSLNGGELPTQMTDSGIPKPLNTVFDALVPLPENDPHGLLRVGLVGRAKISTPPRTLWSRFYRYLARTFNFDL
jgi:putative peptide zinc metalloprotease protein